MQTKQTQAQHACLPRIADVDVDWWTYRLEGVMGGYFHWRNLKCNWGHPSPFHRRPLSMKLPDCVEV